MKSARSHRTVTTFSFGPLLGLGLSLILSSACVPVSSKDSQLLVTGGIRDETSYPATVKLLLDDKITCTGNFIRDDLLITAAHCLLGKSRVSITLPTGNRSITSTHFENNREFKLNQEGRISLETSYTDIGFVHFPAGTATHPMIAKLASEAAKPGLRVTLVGFGENSAPVADDSSASGVRRRGSNRIARIDSQNKNLIIIANPSAPQRQTRENVVAALGDSGAAIYNENSEIVGITSSIGPEGSVHVNTTSGPSRAYILSVLRRTSSLLSSPTLPAGPQLSSQALTPQNDYQPTCQISGLIDRGNKLTFVPGSGSRGRMERVSGKGFSCKATTTRQVDGYFPLCEIACPETTQGTGDGGWCSEGQSFPCTQHS